MARNTVGARELKTRLGTYLRLVQGGRPLVVTDRGRPIAEIRPLSGSKNPVHAALEALDVVGLITRSTSRSLRRCKPMSVGGLPMSLTIMEDREDRR
ncbi:MAG: type II toxin-antitoxin system prevent-host-death family antitoxin [Acidobacteria bacterium]|nr:type II toxin-antitoxin system prevent-host-death family antitoxin [Acidobacteriota bacterium]